MSAEGCIFIALHGQDDNLGDSALRRGLLDSLRSSRRQFHILVGGHGEEYLSGLGLLDSDILYTKRAAWQRRALRSALSGTAAFVSNAGEIQWNRRRTLISAADAVLVAAIRLRRGSAVQTGMGVRDPAARFPAVVAMVGRNCQLVTWRDAQSREAAGFGEVAPDWAFALPAEASRPAEAAPCIAVSMRGDRPMPSDSWFAAVSGLSAALAAELVVVVQVKRDGDRAEELAERLGARLVAWDEGGHRAQESRVRAVYGESIAVLGDRLHALIIGVTEGAVPVGLSDREDAKIGRTFRGAGIDGVSISLESGADEAVREMRARIDDRAQLLEQVARARDALASLSQRILALL